MKGHNGGFTTDVHYDEQLSKQYDREIISAIISYAGEKRVKWSIVGGYGETEIEAIHDLFKIICMRKTNDMIKDEWPMEIVKMKAFNDLEGFTNLFFQ